MENNSNCGIYCWTNKINGKKYIGQSTKLKDRKNYFFGFNHRYAGSRINQARAKYNLPEMWDYQVLEYCAMDDLNEKERYYINFYDTKNRDKGYNLTEGGCVEFSDAYINHLSESMSGEKNPFFGKHHSEETKQKLREIRLGKKYVISEEHYKKLVEITKKRKQPILQIDKNSEEIIKEWDSAIDIKNELGYDNSTIGKCCKGVHKSAYGYIWRYKKESA